MRLQVLASGSGGNATLVRAGETSVLIDAGLDADELGERLALARFAPHRLDAIALTHGHLDHARGAGELARRTGARVLCCERLMKNHSVRRAPRLGALTIGRPLTVAGATGTDTLELLPVEVPHDAVPTVAFRLEHAGRACVVVTDLGGPDPHAARLLAGAHVLVLEFNHDRAALRAGPYPAKLKRRVGGARGHLSNDEAAAFLKLLAGPELHTLVLAHLSRTNNTPELARAAATRALAELGRSDVRVLLAEQDAPGPNLEV